MARRGAAADAAAVEALAGLLLDALEAGRQVPPLTAERPALSMAEAYAVQGRILARRAAHGETVVGWKIGFTNRLIWPEYGVDAPIWGPVYDSTLVAAGSPTAPAELPLGLMPEPRIEPELVLRLARTPAPGMDEAALLACVDAVALGFEVVQSVFPGWRFAAADTAAAFALHGRLAPGHLLPLAEGPAGAWRDRLTRFTVGLARDGETVAEGRAENVLGGPLAALAHLVAGFDPAPFARGLEAGDLISTGTLTPAFPVAPGETWTVRADRLPLAPIGVRLA